MSVVPLFSVVMPVFNKGPYVARAINSVLAQTQPDFELLIVCDPSTDNSTHEVEKFTNQRIRVLYRTAPGPGGYAARNMGICGARAPWIAFLDADDEWLPDHLAQLTVLMRSFPEQKILTSGWIYKGDTSTIDRYSQWHVGSPSHVIDLQQFLRVGVLWATPIWMGVACIQRDVLQNAGLFPDAQLERGGDTDTWFRCILLVGSLAWSSHIGAIYCLNTINQVTKKNVINIPSYLISTSQALSRTDNVLLRRLLHERKHSFAINAWAMNLYVPKGRNFPIAQYLDWHKPFSHQLKCIVYSLVSLLPKPLARSLYQTFVRGRHSAKL